MAEEINAFVQIFSVVAGVVAGGGLLVLFVQFITNVSRNMAHTGTNVTEEITKIARQP